VAGEKIAGIYLEDLPVQALGFSELPPLMTSGRLIAECLQIHPGHSYWASQPAA